MTSRSTNPGEGTERHPTTRATVRPFTPKPVPPEVVTSPRIEQLARAVAADGSEGLVRFWNEVQDHGTPLVEAIPGDAEHCIVTFLWRDAGAANAVLLVANKFTDASVLDASLMEQLAGTDLWHRSYRVRTDWRSAYRIAPLERPLDASAEATEIERWRAFIGRGKLDTFNPKTCPSSAGGDMMLSTFSLVELPDAPPQPWLVPDSGAAAGTMTEFRFASRALRNERPVWVYTPAGYEHGGAAYDLTVLLDGEWWAQSLSIAVTLDNLIAAGVVPPMVVVMPGAIDVQARLRELTCNPVFVEFLVAELLPHVAARWMVSAEPMRTIIAGQSLGGLTAAFAGLHAPERFGNVLAQSGSFWWKHGSEFDTEAEWLTRQYAITPKPPLRFYLEAGLQEWIILPPTRHLRDVLEAKGYDIVYREYNGGHDAACWRGSIADGLIALASR
ncbi:MAG: enterochelin esterase [Dehalococcoidia bacterium]